MANLSRNPPRVSIRLNTAYTTSQAFLRGILRFTQQHTVWTSDIRMGRFDEEMPLTMDDNRLDGLITYIVPTAIRRMLEKKKIPTVLLDCETSCSMTVAKVYCDNLSIARLAAAHLKSQNLDHFAYVPNFMHMQWDMERGKMFCRTLSESCKAPAQIFMGTRQALGDWLASLPRPVGVFAATDIVARAVIDEATALGIRLPSEMAVMGVDDDEIICETAAPTISSIMMDVESAGFKAAQALDRAMATRKIPTRPERISYGGVSVHTRLSTHHLQQPDPLVERCLEIMQTNLSKSFSVNDILKTLHVSRRTLETRFKAAVGCSPHQKIVAFRCEHAQQLLQTTSISQEKISADCCFSSSSHMNTVFRRLYGKPPSVFRSQQA